MFKLDDNLLIELGLGSLPAVEKNRMLSHIYETLEMRVGMKLAQKMTNEQLDEFEAFIDRNDEAGALKWLETNFPDYKQVVAEELERLKGEIKAAAPQIVAESAQQAAANPSPSSPVAMPSNNSQQQYAPPQPASSDPNIGQTNTNPMPLTQYPAPPTTGYGPAQPPQPQYPAAPQQPGVPPNYPPAN